MGKLKTESEPDWIKERRQYMPVTLSRDEIKEAAYQGAPWAQELELLLPVCDRFYEFLKEKEGKRAGLYSPPVCPVCYGSAQDHSLERLMRCAPKHYQREECEHDWAYDFMGGDICRKCGKQI